MGDEGPTRKEALKKLKVKRGKALWEREEHFYHKYRGSPAMQTFLRSRGCLGRGNNPTAGREWPGPALRGAHSQVTEAVMTSRV